MPANWRQRMQIKWKIVQILIRLFFEPWVDTFCSGLSVQKLMKTRIIRESDYNRASVLFMNIVKNDEQHLPILICIQNLVIFCPFFRKILSRNEILASIKGHYKEAKNEPRSEKTGLLGFRPGPMQTRLYSHRRWLEA